VKANGSVNSDDIRDVMSLLGSRKSAAKTAAARRNGKLGGRPRKKKGTFVPTLLITEKGKQS
jgi:hypothetical protein